ncbi:Peptidase S14 [Mesorhizobium loti]|nr:Peptidase S14 [Mesorhizobium loti]
MTGEQPTRTNNRAIEGEILPPDHNKGALIPIGEEIERRRLLRDDKIRSWQQWSQFIGTKAVGLAGLSIFAFQMFHPGAVTLPVDALSFAAGSLALFVGPEAVGAVMAVLGDALGPKKP